tara:strand:+ start:491 stop:637 length:147 start_codon:yes stop_codon:yes gene_type:complete
MKQVQLPIYSLEAKTLLGKRQALKNYLEHLQQAQGRMLCVVPSNGLNK